MKRRMAGLAVIVVPAACVTVGTTTWGDDSHGTTTEDFSGYESRTKVNLETVTGDRSGSIGEAHGGSHWFS